MFNLPAQLVDYHCALEAVDSERNIARAYHIQATRDLFGHTIVELLWGRIGRRAASLTVSFANEDAAYRFIRRTLARRSTAQRRIGVGYTLVGCAPTQMITPPRAANHGR